MKRFLAAFAISVAAAAPVPAADLQLVGQARLKFLFWSVYDSRLLSEDGQYRAGQRPLRLEIEYLLDIEADQLVERTASEWQAQGLRHEHQQQWLQTLATIWPDIRERDVIALELDDQGRSTFYRNGQKLGVLEDTDFGQHFLDIWLSPNTTRPELRLALTGQR